MQSDKTKGKSKSIFDVSTFCPQRNIEDCRCHGTPLNLSAAYYILKSEDI